jgi:hypothetical protein
LAGLFLWHLVDVGFGQISNVFVFLILGMDWNLYRHICIYIYIILYIIWYIDITINDYHI